MANFLDANEVIREIGADVKMLPEEVDAVIQRVFALAVASKPPDWGYAGMLADLVEDGAISDMSGVDAQIKLWRNSPDAAFKEFTRWNERRMADGRK